MSVKYINRSVMKGARMVRSAAAHDCTPYDRKSKTYRLGCAQLRAWHRECEERRMTTEVQP